MRTSEPAWGKQLGRKKAEQQVTDILVHPNKSLGKSGTPGAATFSLQCPSLAGPAHSTVEVTEFRGLAALCWSENTCS